mmetsp:Transcript_17661/g.50589  ORF Transcript_17661/g.50589 Transcript_17661/m.50589 type:complete len:844 (+) Transcript_17661:140-2671(+)
MASSSSSQHLLTQSYYDEVLADNAELHDLDAVATSPSQQAECVRETLEELLPGGVGGGSSPSSNSGDGGQNRTLDHLVLHHPSSPRGREMRSRRSHLESALSALDGSIKPDGTVELVAEGVGVGGDEGLEDDEQMVVERVVRNLRYLEAECSSGGVGILGGNVVNDCDDSKNVDDDNCKDDDDDDNCKDDGGRNAYRSLVLFQTTSSVYTLMSLLGVVSLPSSAAAADTTEEMASDGNGTVGETEGKKERTDEEEREKEERVLRAACRTLTTILSPPSPGLVRTILSAGDGTADTAVATTDDRAGASIAAALSPPPTVLQLVRTAKAEIRDAFVAFERVVGLMGRYTTALAAQLTAESKEEGVEEGGRKEFGATKDLCEMLAHLARLATAACGGCERNKVAFVRAGKSKSSDASTNGCGREGSGGIGAVVAALRLLSDLAKPQTRTPADGGPKVVVVDNDIISTTMAAYCKLLAVLCRFDDFRSPSATSNGAGGGGGALPTPDMTVSSAHDHVLEFHRRGVVPVLHEVTALALGGGGGDAELASAALAATRTLAVNDEIVQALVAVGVLRSARMALAEGVADSDGDGAGKEEEDKNEKAQARQRRSLASASLGLLRNLCGNDEIKTNLCLGTADGNAESATVLPSIVRSMRRYRSDAAVQEHGCATLAAMALRKPANALRIVEEGGPMEVLTAMRRHPAVVPVQRQGSLAVRNISSRLIKMAEAEQNDGCTSTSPKSAAADTATATTTTTPVEVRETFLDLGAESVLRDIAGRHQGSVDEAYAALRDLGCKVSMVRYDTNDDDGQVKSGGRGTRGVTMFGEAKTRFNPVFEESNELGAAVDRL